MILHLGHYLALSAVIFTIGAAGFLARRNALISLMSIELMLNAVNLTLVAANRFQTLTPGGSVTDAAGNVTQAAASTASPWSSFMCLQILSLTAVVRGSAAMRALAVARILLPQTPAPKRCQSTRAKRMALKLT